MIRPILILSLLLQGPLAFTQTIGLGSSKLKDFKSHLSQNPQKKSLNNLIIESSLSTGSDLTESKYSLAVKGLLLADLKPSIYLFKEISDYPSKLIFNDEKSKFISESFFRLANLERLNSEFWIKQGLLYDPDFSPSDEIFNPNIIKSYNEQSKQIKSFLYLQSKSKIAPKESLLFSNGRLVSGSFKVHPSANYQLKFFKEGFESLDLTVSGSDISKLKTVSLRKLDFGSCHNPKFKKYKGIQVEEVFFSNNCIKKRSDFSPNKLANKIHSLDLSKPKPRKNIFQKRATWYIIAGTVVATAIIVSLSQKDKDTVIEPVHL